MSSLKRIHLCMYLLFTTACPTRQETEPQNSNVILTILRGRRGRSDHVTVCPQKAGKDIDSTYTESRTMTCNSTERMCGEDEINGYVCTCKASNPTYVVSKRQCVNNVWLRQGCKFRFGSWRYSSGWTWNKLDDSPLYLHLDDGYGITGGFNASNREFERCTLDNVTALSETGVWGKIEFDSRDITFFVLKGRYHISWNTQNLDSESRKNMRGRILRFSIKCQPTSPRFHNDILRDPTKSCLTFKVTGNTTVSPNKQESNTDVSKGDNRLAIALGVVFSILLFAGVVVGVICYRRRRSGMNITPRFVTDFMAKIT